jgi:hypothetical protein
MEKGTMLHAGYVLDDLQRDIVRKLIVCQFSNRVLWTMDLVSQGKGNVETIPIAPTPELPEEPRFTAKPEVEKESQKRRLKRRAAEKE